MKIYSRYITRAVLAAAGVVAFALLGLSAFFVFIGELGDVGEGHYGVLQALLYIALRVPQGLYQLLPVIALLGALIGLGGLAGGSELVVLRTAGVSVARLAIATLIAGLVLAILTAFLGNYLGPGGAQLAQRVKSNATSGHVQKASGQSIWLRDGRDYVYINAVATKDHLLNIKIFRTGPDQTLTRMLAARSARYQDGRWVLHHVAISRPSAERVEVQHRDSMTWSGHVQPSLLGLFVVDPENLSAAGLWEYARYMRANDVNPGRYAQAFWNRVASPFTVLAMVLLALPFVLGPLRSVSTGQRFFIGVIAGVVFYLANEILGKAAHVYGLPPLAVAWGPTVLLSAAAIWGLRRI